MRAPRSLILITVDCMRADHAGFFGYDRPTTPFLDCLAEESIVFSNAVAAGAPTYYSLPAIMGSRYPLTFGRDMLGLAPDEETLASVLHEAGFATAAFSAGNPYISERFGYARSFDVFRDFLSFAQAVSPPAPEGLRTRTNRALARVFHAFPGMGAGYDELYFQYCQRKAQRENLDFDDLRRFPSADVIVDHALAWLKQNSAQPFFLWLHFMDPHAPYFPNPEALGLMRNPGVSAFEAQYLNAYWMRADVSLRQLASKREQIIQLYDAGIRWADQQIRRLTESLVDLNLWDNCALAVTADHGEEFLDHGGRYHAPLKLTKELVHVPLIVRIPKAAPTRLDSPISLIDLAPTLLDALDFPAPADFRGRSCLSTLSKNQPLTRPVISESVYGCTNPFHSANRLGPRILAITRGTKKLVIDFSSGIEELFDLTSDPFEHNPLAVGVHAQDRRELLECARKHLAESHKSRDFDRRHAMQLRDLRIEWAHPSTTYAN